MQIRIKGRQVNLENGWNDVRRKALDYLDKQKDGDAVGIEELADVLERSIWHTRDIMKHARLKERRIEINRKHYFVNEKTKKQWERQSKS